MIDEFCQTPTAGRSIVSLSEPVGWGYVGHDASTPSASA